MGDLNRLLQSVSDRMETIPKYEKLSEYNIFRVLEVEAKEVIMCRFLADLLNPDGEHGQGVLFLKAFFEKVLKIGNQSDLLISKTRVIKEYKLDAIGSERRIDIVLLNNEHMVPIEAKIYAGEQENQCYDYYNFAVKQDKETKVVYLTRFGSKPSRYSLGDLDIDKVMCIGWEKDIIPWLEYCMAFATDDIPIYIKQYMDAIHDIAYGRNGLIMEETSQIICESAENLRASIAVENSLNMAKVSLIRKVFDEFKEQMKPYCVKYGLVEEKKADYYVYTNPDNDGFYDTYSTWPGLNYIVSKAKFQNPNLQLWFRIEVEHNLFAGFVVYDSSIELDDGTVGYQVDKITEKIAEEASQFVNSESFINDNSWWLNWTYTNGTMAEKDYDDVPNFKRMNDTAILLADDDARKEFVKGALVNFEKALFSQLR